MKYTTTEIRQMRKSALKEMIADFNQEIKRLESLNKEWELPKGEFNIKSMYINSNNEMIEYYTQKISAHSAELKYLERF